jgi:hypothetical protein
MLQFIAIDEIHLFVHFARSFCQEFAWLKPYLFSKLQSCGSASRTTVPVLFMTATCNTTILRSVELLSGLHFHFAFSSPYWSGPLLADPCGDPCSFCDGTYAYMFPCISCRGVVSVFFGLFIVGPCVILDIRRIETVIKAIKEMQHSGRLIFGTNSDKPPAPILVKKLLLMLIAAGILECQHVLVTPNCDAPSIGSCYHRRRRYNPWFT